MVNATGEPFKADSSAINKFLVSFLAEDKDERDPRDELSILNYGLNQDKFLEYYHQRSNVDSTFLRINAKFGGALRNKTRTAQINEVLSGFWIKKVRAADGSPARAMTSNSFPLTI